MTITHVILKTTDRPGRLLGVVVNYPLVRPAHILESSLYERCGACKDALGIIAWMPAAPAIITTTPGLSSAQGSAPTSSGVGEISYSIAD